MPASEKHLRWVVGDNVLKARQVFDVFVVEPLDLEVQVHVVGALTQPVLLVLCKYKHIQRDVCHSIMGKGRTKFV